MSQPEPSKTLTCFYDLKVSPVSFDFVTFMVISELQRIRHKCDSIHMVIVPNQSAGLNIFGHKIDFPASQATWRIFNMLIPIAGLIETCHGITVCPFRDHAEKVLNACEGPVYPDYYSLENPAENSWIFPIILMYANIGLEIPSLTPPQQALEYATTWIDEHSQGKKVISITLREGSHNAIRNSDIAAWSEFVDWLDKDEYFPVILPDIERVMEESRTEFGSTTFFPEAVFNIQLRAAFYRLCYLNLIVGAGPEELTRYDGAARYIKFKAISPNNLNNNPSHPLRHGLPPDGRYPFSTPYHGIVLEEDTFDLIKSEFIQMVEKIEASPEEAFKFHKLEFPQPVDSDHIIKVFKRYIKAMEFFQAFKFVALYLNFNPLDESVINYLINFIAENIFVRVLFTEGSATLNDEQFSPIKKLFSTFHSKHPKEPAWIVGIAMLEFAINNKEQAIDWLLKAQKVVTVGTNFHAITMSCLAWHELNQGNIEKSIEFNRLAYESQPTIKFKMQLALALEHAGEFEEAIGHFKGLLEDGHDQSIIHQKLGLLLKQSGNFKESIEHMMKAENIE